MATPMYLDFVVLYVSDLEASRRYFTETLGLEDDPEQSGPNFHFLKSTGGGISFGLVPATRETPPAGATNLYLAMPGGLEVKRADLIAKGVEVSPIAERPFGTIFDTHSPDGQQVTMLVWPTA